MAAMWVKNLLVEKICLPFNKSYMLKYNKLYQSLKKVSAEWHAGHLQWHYYWNYIIFFDDGSLIEASINNDDFQNIKLNFTKNNQNVTHGNYIFDEREIIIQLNEITFKGSETLEGNIVIQFLNNLNWDKYYIID
jgi:hypothetical protein